MSLGTATKHGAAPVLSLRTRAAVQAAVAAGLLVGFVVVVAREMLATIGVTGSGGAGDEYQLFAVSLTGLAGGVFAVALRAGPDGPRMRQRALRSDALRNAVGAAFVLAYVAAGTIATIVCLVRLGSATDLLKSLAATFLGTSVAVASSLFGITEHSES
jgi:hypothetical protein